MFLTAFGDLLPVLLTVISHHLGCCLVGSDHLLLFCHMDFPHCLEYLLVGFVHRIFAHQTELSHHVQVFLVKFDQCWLVVQRLTGSWTWCRRLSISPLFWKEAHHCRTRAKTSVSYFPKLPVQVLFAELCFCSIPLMGWKEQCTCSVDIPCNLKAFTFLALCCSCNYSAVHRYSPARGVAPLV